MNYLRNIAGQGPYRLSNILKETQFKIFSKIMENTSHRNSVAPMAQKEFSNIPTDSRL
jgi:hypothetical protein